MANLAQIASGTYLPANAAPGNTQYIAPAQQCGMQVKLGVTVPGYQIDVAKMMVGACGFFDMDVNAASTALTTDTIYGFGPIIAGAGAYNRELYTFPGTVDTVPFAVDTAAFTDAFSEVGTHHASAGSSNYLNDFVFTNIPYIICGVTFTDGGSAAGVFDLQASQPWVSQSLRVAANFATTKVTLPANKCSPCLNDTFSVIQWDFVAPISAVTPLTIRIKDGLIGTFRFCTCSDGINYTFIDC